MGNSESSYDSEEDSSDEGIEHLELALNNPNYVAPTTTHPTKKIEPF